MQKLEIILEQESVTKNTHRYREIVESEMVVGTLYIQKGALQKLSTPLGAPQKLKVTIEPVPVE